MKKYLTGIFAVMLALCASAFTSISSQKTEGEYYRNGDTIVPLTPNGTCLSGSNFCTYTLIEGMEDNGDPSHYEGVGTENKQWVPLP